MNYAIEWYNQTFTRWDTLAGCGYDSASLACRARSAFKLDRPDTTFRLTLDGTPVPGSLV